MEGPERLEVDARASRRGTWVALAAAIVVVVGLGAVRLTGLSPDPPSPSPSASAGPGRTTAGWPTEVGSGTLYVRDAGGVVSVDLGSGLVQRSGLDVGKSQVVITAGRRGVLVWPEDGAGTAHEVAAGMTTPQTVTGVLAEGRLFLPGPGLAVWTTPDDPGGDGDKSTWRLVDVDDSVLATAHLRGVVTADGAGGLFAVDDVDVRHVEPGRPSTSWQGSVSAVGPDGWEALRCEPRCVDVLHDRTSGSETPLAYPTPSDFAGPALSPGNRYVAATEQTQDSDDSPVVVRVSVPGERQERRAIVSPEDGSSFAWVSDRWLVAISQRGVVLYDPVDDRLLTPDLGLTLPTQVVVRPAS